MDSWIDITVPLHNRMAHWPGDRPFELRRESDVAAGDAYNLSSFSTSAHAGTHMDAPLHFVPDGASIDQLPFEAAIGPARVIAIEDPARITAAELERHQIGTGQRLLFKTTNSARAWHDEPFNERFVSIDVAAAIYLARVKPLLVGVDYLSVGGYESDGDETHHWLLGAGIWLIEGLALEGVAPGEYELVCLPLRIAGAEGAPARALLRRIAGPAPR
jgi:arylformamidase